VLVKAVVDTNVWVSSLHNPAGVPRQIAERFEADLFVLVCSNELIAELVRVLARPKFAKKIHKEQAERFVALIQRKAVLIQLPDVPPVSRDPKDDMFLACAAVSASDYLVSGDSDLLDLQTHGRTQIVRPAEFLSILEQQPHSQES
jgi:putative PIN family toxin of toxin-antitoxin system